MHICNFYEFMITNWMVIFCFSLKKALQQKSQNFPWINNTNEIMSPFITEINNIICFGSIDGCCRAWEPRCIKCTPQKPSLWPASNQERQGQGETKSCYCKPVKVWMFSTPREMTFKKIPVRFLFFNIGFSAFPLFTSNFTHQLSWK